MIERPILFSGPMVRALLSGAKTQTRRVVSRGNSLVDGSSSPAKQWSWLRFGSPDVFVDGGPSPAGNPGPYLHVPREWEGGPTTHRVYPRVQPGLHLWVRETFYDDHGLRAKDSKPTAPDDYITYRATHDCRDWEAGCPCLDENGRGNWRPSIFMPRWASRITLEVTSVRVQRVQDISEEDARAEGMINADRASGRKAVLGDGDSWWDGAAVYDGAPALYPTARLAFQCLWKAINGKRPGCSWDDNPWVWAISFKRVGEGV